MFAFDFDEDQLSSELQAASLEPVIFSTSPGIAGIPIQKSSRRRSSVYRRLSVKLASYSQSRRLSIPSNFIENHSHQRILTDFEPLKVLGQGAYGKVHLVKDKILGALYAQKQIRKPVIDVLETQAVEEDVPFSVDQELGPESAHPSHIHRTIAERQILSRITHHQNIVKLFYAFQDHDRFYLMLEYLPGGELFHHLTTNNSLGNVFLEEHTAFYAAQMALGLRHLHLLGIVYRDLKPENCLLNSLGHLVLTDFGLLKAIGTDNEECTLIIGTPEYMAPEIIRGEAYDYAVDWWLLGCVVFDMMTGKPPFTGRTHVKIQEKILKAKPNIPFYLSQDARDILNKLLQKNPAKRLPVDDCWEQFQKHRFFRKVDWNAVQLQSAMPPVIPVISDPALAENFSPDFTSMKMSTYDLAPGQTMPNMFLGFSFTASTTFFQKYA